MSELLERLPSRGWRLTPPERLVADVRPEPVGLSPAAPRGYRPFDLGLAFRGVCPRCQ